MIAEQFIQAGWYTVPLQGILERNPSTGKKTIPIFETNWNSKYTNNFNLVPCELMGAITGKQSNIIAIDCDNESTYKIFCSLDPTNTFHFISKGKATGGGTIIYKYNTDIASFRINDGYFALDVFSDGGFIYLPTENNKTKEEWKLEKLPEIKELPSTIKNLLLTLANKKLASTEERTYNSPAISNRLAPMLEEFTSSKTYNPVLFKMLTPKDFRNLPKYVKQNHIHPNDIPLGRGSEYLSKISAILGADISVNKELYVNTMDTINKLWEQPMEEKRLLATIINPMIDEKVVINNEIVWQYDKYWQKMGFIATAINGDYVESFFDDVKSAYYIINYTSAYVKLFTDKRTCMTTLKTLLGRNITEAQYDTTKRLVRTGIDPSKEFGHIEQTDKFNLFRQTAALNILNYPELYSSQYKPPKTIINYFNTLIPDDFMRSYVLSFIRTKLTTFDYSPIVLYFIGTHGSGKDTFVNILNKILGQDYITKPDTKVFLEQYNAWLMDRFFVHLDEYGNKLTRMHDKQEALGKIKSISGSPDVQIRAMRQDGFNYEHSITFILTANSNPLPLETEDRRIAFVKTPNRLDKQEWVIEAGGISEVIKMIANEILDFSYYLATEIRNLTGNSYVIAPETKDKEQLIMDSMPAYEQILYYLNHHRYKELEDLSIEHGISNFTEGWKIGRLSYNKLYELYTALTEGRGSPNSLLRSMRNAGYKRQSTTKDGTNYFFWYISDLYSHTASNTVVESSHFSPVDINLQKQ